jgi:membrane protease YdiL (CAAX protease family)
MNSVSLILLVLALAVLWLDVVAARKVLAASIYSQGQLWAQAALILFLPLLGAALALYLCREDLPLFQKPPVDDVRDIDPTMSDFDYHG